METQKIINLLDEDDDKEFEFETKNGILLIMKVMDNMVKEMKKTLQ